MEETFGKKPIPYRSGGSIPIISTFEEKLGLKSILMGFGLESDAIHSPNEMCIRDRLSIMGLPIPEEMTGKVLCR